MLTKKRKDGKNLVNQRIDQRRVEGVRINDDRFSGVSWVVIVCFSVLALLVVGGLCYVSIVMYHVPTSKNLNQNTDSLTVGDVWTIDDQFCIWIDDVSEVSGTVAQGRDNRIVETDGKRYFDVSFSFQNINFPGCTIGDTVEKYLSVRATAFAIGEDGKKVWPTTLQVYDQNPYQTVWQEDETVFVTSGITSSDNHLIIEVEETEISTSLDRFMIRFLVPVEVLSTEASIHYQQDFRIGILQ